MQVIEVWEVLEERSVLCRSLLEVGLDVLCAPDGCAQYCDALLFWRQGLVAHPCSCSRSSVFGGWCLALFQMRVLPLLSRMRAVSCKWCANRS